MRLSWPAVDPPRAAKRVPVTTLTIHLYVGFLVAALAVLAVWRRPERRITLYVVTLQIVLGIVLMAQHLRVPWYHPALAVLAWAGYMVANALGRRPGKARVALFIAAGSSVLILLAYYAGMEAVKHAAAG